MKPYFVLLICLFAIPAHAQDFAFRGDFVETYLSADGFLDTIPRDTRLNCETGMCSFSKSVRIYVFKNKDGARRFWSTNYVDVMFDEPEALLACGKTGHVVYYDQSNQLLSRHHVCQTEPARRFSFQLALPVFSARTGSQPAVMSGRALAREQRGNEKERALAD